LTPDFWAMSLKDTSVEERSIIRSLAATRSLSAVVFLAACCLIGTLVFNAVLFPALLGDSAGQISPSRGLSQELID
jgi:hypothetical protein